MADLTLKPCPFCGCEMTVYSNRDWHRLFAKTLHTESCIWSADIDPTLSAPATDVWLQSMTAAWNQRAALEQPSEAMEVLRELVEAQDAWERHARGEMPSYESFQRLMTAWTRARALVEGKQ